MKEVLSILLLESNQDDVVFHTSALNRLYTKEIEAHLTTASILQDALLALTDQTFDLIITDLNLPDSQGLDTLIELQKKGAYTPIIIVGAMGDDELVREAIRLGAQDYLPKTDLNTERLARIIHNAIERSRLHESLRALSFTDELTGLYNRRGFVTFLQQQIFLSQRMNKGFHLFLADLDYLKQINDTYGHLTGDQALVALSRCLQASFRRHDIIGRIGGDEFAILAINTRPEDGERLKTHMLQELHAHNLREHLPYSLSFSVGYAYYDGTRPVHLEELFQEADTKLYQAKRLAHSLKTHDD